MRSRIFLAAAAIGLCASITVRVLAQGATPPPPPPPQGGGQGAGQAGQGGGAQGAPGRGAQGGGRAGAIFPAQQRALADPAVIERGKSIYGINCTSCHGADLRGGDMGGPNLLRSQLVLNDQDGELVAPIIKGSRQAQGMDPIALSDADIKAVAAYLHAIQATMRGQGNPPAGPTATLNVLVGDATAGQAYFQQKCSSCHSATGDLQGIGSRISDPMQLQNYWVAGGGRGGRGGGAPGAPNPREVTVTVVLPNGEKVTGRRVRLDDFIVILAQADGTQRSFTRTGDVPKVTINDPLEPHNKLLTEYTDRDIHNVTAYLVTLK